MAKHVDAQKQSLRAELARTQRQVKEARDRGNSGLANTIARHERILRQKIDKLS
jgi:hypothetical protein